MGDDGGDGKERLEARRWNRGSLGGRGVGDVRKSGSEDEDVVWGSGTCGRLLANCRLEGMFVDSLRGLCLSLSAVHGDYRGNDRAGAVDSGAEAGVVNKAGAGKDFRRGRDEDRRARRR